MFAAAIRPTKERSERDGLSMRNKLFLALAVSALALTVTNFAGAQQAPAAGAPAAADRKAIDQYKDLKVLGDVPVGQFLPGMRVIATSLGVECEFCHLGKRTDETPNKATARKMMTMMMEINKSNFN